VNIERALKVEGFMHEKELEYLASLAQKSKAIMEVGSWSGRSARAFADNTPGLVFCTDTWADNAYGSAPAEETCIANWLWSAFQRNVGYLNHVFSWRMNSIDGAAKAIAHGFTFDLIFIDAGHEYEDVKADILAWRPLLREGGILAGHDLYPDGPYHPGVLQAVNELVGKYTVHGTIWSTEGA